MYTLYYSPGSASMAPHGVLEESGAAYTLARVDMAANKHKDAAYLKLNPHGRVPTLVVDGKQPIYEATAICLFIADRHPSAGLAPAVTDLARGLYYQWMAYLTNTLQATCLLLYYPERNTANPAHAAEVKAQAETQIMDIWSKLDKALAKGPYLLGAHFSAADIYLHMLYSWMDPPMQMESRYPNVARSAGLVAARPAIMRTLQQNQAA
jgi:glutathione S-transferase